MNISRTIFTQTRYLAAARPMTAKHLSNPKNGSSQRLSQCQQMLALTGQELVRTEDKLLEINLNNRTLHIERKYQLIQLYDNYLQELRSVLNPEPDEEPIL